ncbi:MAG: QueT transporter family protein [Eubacteriales bacterium]
MKKQNIRFIATAGMIGALYVVLTLISAMFGLSSGVIQVRISEMLCVLPAYTAAAIPRRHGRVSAREPHQSAGPCGTSFSELSRRLSAVAAYFMRHTKYLAFIRLSSAIMIIIPTVLILSGLGGWNMFPYFALTVGLGEIISCGVFGDLMVLYFERHPSVVKTLFDSSPVRAAEKA